MARDATMDAATIVKETLIILGSNIQTEREATAVMEVLTKMENVLDVSIDLEDRERVVRMECNRITEPSRIMVLLEQLGFVCYLLPDH